MCMYIYMYIHIHIPIYTYIYINICTYAYMYIYVYIYRHVLFVLKDKITHEERWYGGKLHHTMVELSCCLDWVVVPVIFQVSRRSEVGNILEAYTPQKKGCKEILNVPLNKTLLIEIRNVWFLVLAGLAAKSGRTLLTECRLNIHD